MRGAPVPCLSGHAENDAPTFWHLLIYLGIVGVGVGVGGTMIIVILGIGNAPKNLQLRTRGV